MFKPVLFRLLAEIDLTNKWGWKMTETVPKLRVLVHYSTVLVHSPIWFTWISLAVPCLL